MTRIIYGLVMLGVGALFFIMASHISYTYISSQNWQKVSATITDVNWDAKRSNLNKSVRRYAGGRKGVKVYRAGASYSYDFEGRSYNSDRVALVKGFTSDHDAQRRIYNSLKSHLDNNTPYPAFVNPKTPSQAVLIRQHSWLVTALMFVFGLIGLLIGGSVFWSSVRKD